MIKIFPICKKIKLEGIFPEKAFLALKKGNSYLLESVEGEEKKARFSFLGFRPLMKVEIKDKKTNLKIFHPALKNLKNPKGKNALEILKNLILEFKLKKERNFRFFGGLVGYFSYDLVRQLYPLNLKKTKKDDLKELEAEFLLTQRNLIFDHKTKETFLLSFYFSEKEREKIERENLKILNKIKNFSLPKIEKKKANKNLSFLANIAKKEFKEMVKKAKEYIFAGDIFQVVLSQRFETKVNFPPFLFYQNLKKINPSPYMYYLDFGKRKIIGSSPEMLVKVEKGEIETFPIAGTRKRGKDLKEDKILEKEMLNDEKERAEHIMLVDLARNDISKVAEFKSVKVKKLMKVEKYSHVQHLVSEVVGKLRKGEDEFSAFEALFPAGTVTGAPKIRAMEIIDELEKQKRGIYAGAVGYFSFNRNMNFAITIRTMVIEGERAFLQAGAGIVADSLPEREYQETINKAKALMKALLI